MVVISLIAAIPLALAASDQDTQAQLEALQAQIETMQSQYQEQIKSMQEQLETLKQQMATQIQEQEEEKLAAETKKAKWTELAKHRNSGIQGWVRKSEGFKLRDVMGLEEEGMLNITGEINMRYRENVHREGSSYGFQFYELGLMLDAIVNDWTSAYAEFNLNHSNKAEAEDVWIDLHLPAGDQAFAGGTGLKIGQFHAPFGWDNDDCEGFVYGGRTSVNAALMRSERIDGQRLRERQIGIQGNYNFNLGEDLELILSGAVFNGNGAMLSYGGSDNDRKKDFATRLEAHFLNTALGASFWHSPGTGGGVTSNTNNSAHVRALDRYGLHFKYPADVPFPGGDPSLGGEKYLIWAEALYGIAEGNGISEGENVTLSAFNDTQKFWGVYAEADVSLIPEKLLGFLRVDYWEPDIDDGNDIVGITPGLYITLWPGISVLTLEYEHYQGGSQDDNDRLAAELQIFF
jgi:hypothetical protein